MSALELIRQGLILAGAVGAIAFPIYYWITAPGWHRSDMGRFLMLGALGWASLYLSGVVFILFPSELLRDVVRLLLIVGAGTFAWYQVFLYRKVRREELARKRKEGIDATE